MRRNAIQIGKCFILTAMAAVGSGCTPMLWQWAQTPPDHILRFDDDGMQSASEPTGQKILEIKYRSYINRDLQTVLRIPLGADGRAAAPFAYTGQLRTVAEFWKSIPNAQRAAILRTRPNKNSVESTPGQTIPIDVQNHWGCELWEPGIREDNGAYTGTNGLVALAYRADPSSISLVSVFDDDHPSEIPQGSWIVLVPDFVVADDPSQPARVAVAIVGTPVSLAVDAALIASTPVLFPILLVIWAPVEKPASELHERKTPSGSTTTQAN